MPIESTDDVLAALRASGLLTPDRLTGVAREAEAAGGDPGALVKALVKRKVVTFYQLKKVIHGRASDLFVGGYVITDKLGEGGMGKVFRARDPLGRTVALKVVRPGLVSNPVIRGRYEREVRAASKLDHPNIVRVLDAGAADGKFYMAMEFVDGIDLSRLMKDCGRLEVPEACEYVRQAALGLQHAHEGGFVHRDVKPSNVVVAGTRHVPRAAGPVVVKLLDLGLARATDPDEVVAPDLTSDHAIVGTPDFIAPEQAKNSRAADRRADLYSLGCTLYYLLVGRVPFPVETAIEKVLAHHSDVPTPVQALRPQVPAAVAQLVARLMAKHPDDRIQSGAELATLLEPHCAYPPGAGPGPAPQPAHAPEPPSFSSVPITLPLELGGSSVVRNPLRELVNAPPSDPPTGTSETETDRTARAATLPDLPPPRPAREPDPRPVPAPGLTRSEWLGVAVALGGVALLVLALYLLIGR